jgi:hypothetical protein
MFKNATQLHSWFALSNLWMLRRTICPAGDVVRPAAYEGLDLGERNGHGKSLETSDRADGETVTEPPALRPDVSMSVE